MADTKTCAKCRETKPLSGFAPDRKARDGRSSYCRACRRADARLYRQANPEKAREASRRYQQANPEKAAESTRRWHAAHPESRQRARQRRRDAVLDHYGRSCACCGSTERLTIDHVNGDGKQHRAELGIRTGTHMTLWLIRNGFPDGFQVLCGPCNASKRDGAHCRLDHAKQVAS